MTAREEARRLRAEWLREERDLRTHNAPARSINRNLLAVKKALRELLVPDGDRWRVTGLPGTFKTRASAYQSARTHGLYVSWRKAAVACCPTCGRPTLSVANEL